LLAAAAGLLADPAVLLAAALLVRFFRTGAGPMLKMLGGNPAQPEHHTPGQPSPPTPQQDPPESQLRRPA
jgi:hypothetical protein